MEILFTTFLFALNHNNDTEAKLMAKLDFFPQMDGGFAVFSELPLHAGRTRTLQPAAACMILISQPEQALSEVGANTVNQSYPNGGYYFTTFRETERSQEDDVLQREPAANLDLIKLLQYFIGLLAFDVTKSVT